jgi:hypothetical protein
VEADADAKKTSWCIYFPCFLNYCYLTNTHSPHRKCTRSSRCISKTQHNILVSDSQITALYSSYSIYIYLWLISHSLLILCWNNTFCIIKRKKWTIWSFTSLDNIAFMFIYICVTLIWLLKFLSYFVYLSANIIYHKNKDWNLIICKLNASLISTLLIIIVQNHSSPIVFIQICLVLLYISFHYFMMQIALCLFLVCVIIWYCLHALHRYDLHN